MGGVAGALVPPHQGRAHVKDTGFVLCGHPSEHGMSFLNGVLLRG